MKKCLLKIRKFHRKTSVHITHLHTTYFFKGKISYCSFILIFCSRHSNPLISKLQPPLFNHSDSHSVQPLFNNGTTTTSNCEATTLPPPPTPVLNGQYQDGWNTNQNQMKNTCPFYIVAYLDLIPWKLQKLLTANANNILWHFFHRTLFFQPIPDFLVWCPSCACTVLSSRMSSKIVSVCSQYRERGLNSMTVACFSEYHFVTLK